MLRPKNDILQGWKDIAAHLGRDVRTVRRWEKQRHLPVRRTQGEGRASVYALTEDLNEWLLYSPAVDDTTDAALAELPSPPAVLPVPPTHSLLAPPMAMLGCLLLAIGISVYQIYAHHVFAAAPTSESYRSPIAGVDELFLQGVYLYEQRTPRSLLDARELLMQAVSKDPADAPAWSSLASVNIMLQQVGALDSAHAFGEARTAATRALQLDGFLGEARASLGFIDFLADGDALKAESEFKLALSRDPKSVCAHHRYGIVLMQEGRFPEAMEQLNLAQHLDPGSTVILASRALAMGYEGHRDEAVRLLLPVAAQQSNNPVIHARLASLAGMKPIETRLYLEQRQKLNELVANPSPIAYDKLLDTLKRSGETAAWQDLLAEAKIMTGEYKWLDVAGAEAQLGQNDLAFATLNDAMQRNPLVKNTIRSATLLEPLRADPRFDQLLISSSGSNLASDVPPSVH